MAEDRRSSEPDQGYLRAIRARLEFLLSSGLRPETGTLLRRMRGAPLEELLAVRPDLTTSSESIANAATSEAFEPHPLDYHWTFCPETVDRVSATLMARAEPVVVVGAPTIADRLKERGKQFTFIDRNPLFRPDLTLDLVAEEAPQQRRLESSIPRTFFLDPPWYPDYVAAWLNFVALHCKPVQTIFMSLWPELTRPSAEAERKTVIDWLSSCGDIVIHPDALTYGVPTFERLTYEARQLAVPTPWRTGDLIELRCSEEFLPPRKMERSWTTWQRYVIGRRQLAFKLAVDRRPPEVEAVGFPSGHFHLQSVSRRDPIRREANLLTSNNIAARVAGLSYFLSAIELFYGQGLSMASLSHDQQNALVLMRDIGCIETAEHTEFMSWQHRD